MAGPRTQPLEIIRVQRSGSNAFKCAVAETQGRRPSHEDAHAVQCTNTAANLWVLDGHRGDGASHFGTVALAKEVGNAVKGSCLPTDERILRGFETVDRKLRGHLKNHHAGCNAGSTVVGALIAQQADGSYVAKLVNCGDSRGVLVHGPGEDKSSVKEVSVRLPKQLEEFKQQASWAADASWLPAWPAIVETIDHKPSNPMERARIEAAGGHVSGGKCARLDGQLAVSRGLGDFDFKCDRGRSASEQKVSCEPDIYEVTGLQPGTLLLLACDGLWDVMSSETAAHFVRARLRQEPDADLGDIATELIRSCLRLNGGDNVTVLLTHFVEGSAWADIEDEMIGLEHLAEQDFADKAFRKQYDSFLRGLGLSHEFCMYHSSVKVS